MQKWHLIVWWTVTAIIVMLIHLAANESLRTGISNFLVPSTRTWHDLLTAIGTCAAVIVALWLGVDARRQAARQQIQIAQLVASEISGRLSHLLDTVVSLDAALTFSPVQERRTLLKRVRDALADNQLTLFRRDTLTALIPLPLQAAHRIARAMDYLRLLRSRLIQRELEIGSASDALIERLHNNTLQMLEQVRYELEIAAAECYRAALIAAPYIPPDDAWNE
ncbi:MAG TPA: hypothetical protein VF522_21675 [Ramlibacter sp.]|uniref:hypothetical protein n=1 Tax=Ramlibacter sp. TaxID=1917967 RepID=UPI002ED5904C